MKEIATNKEMYKRIAAGEQDFATIFDAFYPNLKVGEEIRLTEEPDGRGMTVKIVYIYTGGYVDGVRSDWLLIQVEKVETE